MFLKAKTWRNGERTQIFVPSSTERKEEMVNANAGERVNIKPD